MSDDGYSPLCPMPVLRLAVEADDFGDGPPEVQVCGETLFLHVEGGDAFYEGEAINDEARQWQVTCGNGHVLFVQDDEGNDRLSMLPFDNDQAVNVIRRLAHWVDIP